MCCIGDAANKGSDASVSFEGGGTFDRCSAVMSVPGEILDDTCTLDFFFLGRGPPTASTAFFWAASKIVSASSVLRIDGLNSARSYFTDTYAAEACSEVSNVPMYRSLPFHRVFVSNFPFRVFRTPRGSSLLGYPPTDS